MNKRIFQQKMNLTIKITERPVRAFLKSLNQIKPSIISLAHFCVNKRNTENNSKYCFFWGGGAYFNTFNHCLDILDPHFANADFVYRLAYTELNFLLLLLAGVVAKLGGLTRLSLFIFGRNEKHVT